MSIISKDLIVAQLESTEEFPILLSDVWEWLGYSKKENALQSFRSLEMAETIDFIQLLIDQELSIKPLTEIKMTVDCFKFWAMSARTERGKEVRRYYLQVEKEWKSQKLSQPQVAPEHVAAYQFQESQFKPWADQNPLSVQIFLGWQGLDRQVLTPVAVERKPELPDAELQQALNGAFLNLNRSGLVLNKMLHFIDRVPTMDKMNGQAIADLTKSDG